MNTNAQLRLILATAVAPIVWGTTYAVTTEILPAGHPLFAGLARALPAGLLAIALTRAVPRGEWLWKSFVLGALNIGMFFPLLFLTAERLPGGVAATLGAIQPLAVAVLASGLLGERASSWRVGWGVVGAAGVGLVVLGPAARLDLVGVIAGLAGALSMALGVVLSKKWGRPAGVSPMGYAGWLLTAGGLVLVVPTLVIEGVPGAVAGPAYAGYLWLGLVGGLVAYTLWFRGIGALPAAPTAMLGILSPLTAAVIGVAVLGERLTTLQVLGFIAALSALVAAQLNGPRTLRGVQAIRPLRSSGGRLVAQAAIWGSSFTLIREASSGVSPSLVVLSRLALATVVLIVVVRLRGEHLVRGWRAWLITGVGAVFAQVLPYLLLTYGERTTPAGVAGVLVGMTPLLTVLISAVALRREPVSRSTMLGFGIAFGGIVLVVNPFGGSSGSLVGALLCLGAAASYAAGYVWARRFQTGIGTPMGAAASQIAAATAIQALVTPVLGVRVGELTFGVVAALVLLGVLATGYATILYFRLVADIGASRAASVNYLVPVFAVAIGALVGGESIGAMAALGAAAILIGMGIGEGKLQPLLRKRIRSRTRQLLQTS